LKRQVLYTKRNKYYKSRRDKLSFRSREYN